jgi:hypothetical protein
MSETTSYYKKVASVTVTSGGADYTSVPTVIIGGNATATATVANGRVTAITVTFAGNNYLSPPTIAFTGGGGTGATATANMVYIDDSYNGFKQSLSHLIANQLPDFVRTEYPVFITFLEKYYEFLDEENQVNNFLLNYEKNFDINRTLDTFIPKFKNQYAQNFPLDAQIDDRRLIKFIKQFYEAKGSEKAIELLFRILYNERTEIFYPSEQILRASDGIWIEDVTLKLAVDSSITANPFDLNSKTVRITYYENISSVTYERTIETNISNVTKFAYIFPAVYELVTSLPKNARILVPGAGAVASALVSGGQVRAIVGETNIVFNSATAVNVTSNTITLPSHGYSTGDVVIYDRNGGTIVTGLTNYAVYFVIVIDTNTIKLATSAGNATIGTAVDLTVVGSGNHRLYAPVTDAGNGYFATPTVQFTSLSGTSATARPILTDTGEISHVIITNGGSGYSSAPAVTFSTDSIRTKVEIVSGTTVTEYGYIVRQLETVDVIDCSGTPPCGFTVGDIFSIDESGSTGPYTVEFENETLEYFLNKYNETDVAVNPYTLVGRDNKASIRIDAVDADGCPTAVSIFDTGFDFERETFTAIIESALGCTATLSFTTGAVNVKTGRFRDSRGMLSNVNKLQDNFYYQNYSYVIRSNVPSNKWLDIVKNTTHPAGTAIFGELTIEQTVDFRQFITTPIQPLHIYEFVLEELFASGGIDRNDEFYFEVDFIKVLTDTATTQPVFALYAIDYFSEDYTGVGEDIVFDFSKILFDSVTIADLSSLDFTVGIYEEEGDTTETTDVFDRVVQYFREVNETTITAENTITDLSKIVNDSTTTTDNDDTHVFKILSDAITSTDLLSFDFNGEDEVDAAEATDLFDRIVQYVREASETTITADNAVTDFGKVLQETIFLQDPYAQDFFDENYVAADTTSYNFSKVIADIANTTESQAFVLGRSLTDTATAPDTFTRTVEYYRTFTESVISNEYANAGIEKPRTDEATVAETSTNHLYKSLTDSITSTDTIGIIPYIVKTDNAGATELLIVANDSATIESIAAAEESLITVLKGIFETVAVTEDGIINLQNYIEGDFGSDYVGQSMTFAGTNSSFPVPNSILNLDAGNSLSYSGTGTTWTDMSGNNRNGTLTNTTYTDPYFTFNGTNSQVSIADNALLEPGTGDFTVETWVRATTLLGSSRVIIGKFNNGGASQHVSYALRTLANGTTRFEVGNGTSTVNSPTFTISTDTWYQIVGVWSNVASNSIELYVNGVSQGSNSHAFTSVLNSSNPLYVGTYNGGEYSQGWVGNVSAVRYYNTALTAEEVTQNFTALRGRFDI